MGNFARASFLGTAALVVVVASCVGGEQNVAGTATDAGADSASDGSTEASTGDGGTIEGGKPTPTGKVQWVYTVDVSSANIHVAYDDAGDVFFAMADSGTSTVDGVAIGHNTTVVGKINPDGSRGWLKAFDVESDIYGLDIAATANGDVWLLGGATGTQMWPTGNVAHVSSDFDLYFAHLDGSNGNVKSVYPITAPAATGGLVLTNVNLNQSVHLARAGNQLVGAFGHNGNVQLPGPAGNISIPGSGQTVTVFRADPLTGIVSNNDSFHGTGTAYSPGGISVRDDGTMAVAVDVYGASGNTITNTAGDFSYSQTTTGMTHWITVASYTTGTTIGFSAPLNNDVTPDGGVVPAAYANGVALDSAGNVILSGNFEDPIKLNNVTQPFLGGIADAFIAKVRTNGTVAWSPILGSSDDENGAAVAVDPWDDIAATLNSGGTINALKTTGGGTHFDQSVDQFKVLSDGGISWNAGINDNAEVADANYPTPVSVAVDPRNGNIAFGGYFSGNVDLGKGGTTPPHSAGGALFVIQRSP